MIRQLRIERVMRQKSQLDVALQAQVSSTRVSLIERGIVEPTLAEAERLGKLFGVAPQKLLQKVGLSDSGKPFPSAG